ncbi:MAG: prolyl oligopeptidase family serine peptidase [Bryobacteraceae bacterium]|jgi:prolyl oligopeptidase
MLRDCLVRKTFTALAAVAAICVALAESGSTLVYPPAPRTKQVDDYHGRPIADPYRTLEDPDNPATRAWIEAEVKLTDQWLAAIPQRDSIKRRLTQLFDYERYPASALTNFSRAFIWSYAGAFSAGSHYFLMRNSGLQNQAVLYTIDAQGNQPNVLLDPNTFRKDGTAALCGLAPSRDGSLLAFGTAQAGSDWCEWRIRNVESGQDLPEVLQWTKDAAPAWTVDNRAFYYVRYPKPPEGQLLTAVNRNPQVMLHRVGEAADRDRFVYEDPAHADSGLGPVLTADARWLIVHEDLPQDSSRNMLYFEDLSATSPRMALLTPDPKGLYDYAGSQGSRIYLRTTDGAPKGRMIAIDLNQPGRGHWVEVVAETPDNLDHACLAGGRLLLSYLHNAHARAVLYSLETKTTSEVAFDGIGTANWSPAQPDSSELFYSFVTFTSPAALYRLDVRTGRSTLLRSSKVSFDAGQYRTDQVFYPSKDGTKVSMFVVHRKDMLLDGRNPTILYGYGGFNLAITPSFNPSMIEWLEMGGVFAEANLRGGSEYGEAWHLAGARHNKQNVFDDFIAGAEWLIHNHYTSTPKLAIFGGSNGGLLVGACLNQRPDLFGAAMPAVGVMDMLRFHKFTAGAGWVGEYGSPDDAQDFQTLLAYSPLHNIRQANYPATLITTSDHDDRVVPGHSFKYAATLQESQQGAAPILIRIETRAGHGAGTPTSKTIDEYADRWAFLVKVLDFSPKL